MWENNWSLETPGHHHGNTIQINMFLRAPLGDKPGWDSGEWRTEWCPWLHLLEASDWPLSASASSSQKRKQGSPLQTPPAIYVHGEGPRATEVCRVSPAGHLLQLLYLLCPTLLSGWCSVFPASETWSCSSVLLSPTQAHLERKLIPCLLTQSPPSYQLLWKDLEDCTDKLLQLPLCGN